MPVDTQHPDYQAAVPKWKRIRDVLGGEDSVKAAGEAYLPRLSEQSTPEYDSYRSRAQFFNATGRTHLSLLGFIYRKDPTLTLPDALAPFTRDATLNGLAWYDYAKAAVAEVLGVGRCGTLVDFQSQEGRPYVVPYTAESIINWRTDRVQGQTVLTLLVLFERDGAWLAPADAGPNKPPEEPDEYEHVAYDQWRVYRVVADDEGAPFVMCEVWRLKNADEKGKPEFVMVSQVVPTRRGVALERIPFVFHGPHNSQPDVDKAPLEDMAQVNLSLYRTSADLENGRHFCGVPTPWAAGFQVPEGESLKVGSTTAWVTNQAQAKVGYLEFSGSGLTPLEKAVESKKAEMAALGARMLEPEAKKAEAYDTVAVRAAAETSALTTATVSSTQSLSRVLQLVAWWAGTAAQPEDLTETAKMELNTEFTVTALPAEQITALTNAYLGGAIDWESYFWKMQQGECFPPDVKAADVLGKIQNSKPPGVQPPEPDPAPAL